MEDPRVGTILSDRYRIIERIASGGMGVVYRGERLELGKPVAIKFIQELLVSNDRVLARFQREALAMSKLAHPYCVSVIDFGVLGSPYIVMDYVEGQTLKEILDVVRLPIGRALRLTGQVLAAVAHAHSQGIVHRDIKPENIMICQAVGMGEHVRVFDFGLARLLDANEGAFQSMTSVMIGTPHYMSPEQSRTSKVDARADIYSIGVVLFELLTGRKLFSDDQPFEIVRMHRETVPPSLRETEPTRAFSAKLESVLSRALAKRPEDRFQTADEFWAALSTTPEGWAEQASAPAGFAPMAPAIGFEDTVRAEIKPHSSGKNSMAARPVRTKLWTGVALFVVLAVAVVWLIWMVGIFSKPPETSLPVVYPKAHPAPPTWDARDNGSNTAPAPADKPLPKIVGSIDDVQALIDAGDPTAAIEGLKKLRRESPKNGQLPYLLANLYFDKMWWSDAISLYQEAIRLSDGYRKKEPLNRNLVTALSSDKTAHQAESAILMSVGKPALPYLSEAAKKTKNPKVHRRINALAERLKRARL